MRRLAAIIWTNVQQIPNFIHKKVGEIAAIFLFFEGGGGGGGGGREISQGGFRVCTLLLPRGSFISGFLQVLIAIDSRDAFRR